MKSTRILNGYKLIYKPENPSSMTNKCWKGYVYEHIVVMEELLGRRLKEGEVVHHLDCCRSNNHTSNLILLSRGDHKKLHGWIDRGALIDESYEGNGMNSEKPWVKQPTYCKTCGKTILRRGQIYCSNVCNGEDKHKVEHPTKEQLQREMFFTTWVDLGKKYGVSDNAVRKWAKKYGLLGNSEPSRKCTS